MIYCLREYSIDYLKKRRFLKLIRQKYPPQKNRKKWKNYHNQEGLIYKEV
jgi:hypothetical protein